MKSECQGNGRCVGEAMELGAENGEMGERQRGLERGVVGDGCRSGTKQEH